MRAKALITGSNGFVGAYLKAELEKSGYEVFGIGKGQSGQSNYAAVDITDQTRLTEVVSQVKPTHLFHLAGVGSVPDCEERPGEAFEVNVEGTRNILTASVKLNPPPKILLVSSVHVYGEPAYLPIDEQHPLRGQGAYAESRIKQEAMARTYLPRLPVVIARSFNHTGPGQTAIFVVSKIMKQIAEIKHGRRDSLELGNTEVKRDITDVRDVVRAYRLLLEQNQFGITGNVCRGYSTSLKYVIEFGRVVAGMDHVDVRVVPKLLRPHDWMDVYGETRYLRTLIAWQPAFSLDQTLRDIYKYWQDKVYKSGLEVS